MWRSLVARLLREQEAAGSNPVIPTSKFKHLGHVAKVLFLLILRQFLNFQKIRIFNRIISGHPY
jgi:hypothetical protein